MALWLQSSRTPSGLGCSSYQTMKPHSKNALSKPVQLSCRSTLVHHSLGIWKRRQIVQIGQFSLLMEKENINQKGNDKQMN